MTGKQLIKLLKGEGWNHVRTNGGHYLMEKDGVSVSVPVHGSKDIKIGTLKQIEKKTGLKF